METLGYSERGLLNSLFYEIKYSHNSLQLLNELLSLVSFPYMNDVHFNIKDVKILIEQSFSDFGDADTVLAMVNDRSKQCAFIEAKVKTYQRKSWSIEEIFNDFTEGIEQNKVRSSNLFVQLYYKVRLINALQIGGITLLKKGTDFPKCCLTKQKTVRKIGNNRVVLNAVELLSQFNSDAFFIAIVPQESSKVKIFYQNILKNFNPNEFQEWDVSKWGYISWADIEDFCKKQGLEETQKVFKFNEGQVY